MPRVGRWGWLAALAVGCCVALWLCERMRRVMRRPRCARELGLFEHRYKTGDVLVVSNRVAGLTHSNMIKLATGSEYNHIGVIYVEPRTRHVYIWEMVASGPRLLPLGRVPFEPEHEYYCVRALNQPVDVRLFERCMKYQWDMTFNWDATMPWYNRFAGLPASALRGHAWGRNRQRTCAHLAAELYQLLGVFDFSSSGSDPYAVFPVDFTEEHQNLPLARGYSFGPSILLLYEPQQSDPRLQLEWTKNG